eukprot:GHVU01140643.1.p1 GENE.GHVU01140643.1~~GHVU01140643.1.p1  ORF type:complete len:193 (+),score=2.90 GHVU01140643.1:333-911(+)
MHPYIDGLSVVSILKVVICNPTLTVCTGASYIPSSDGYAPPRSSRAQPSSRTTYTNGIPSASRTSDLRRGSSRSSNTPAVPQTSSDLYDNLRSKRQSSTKRASYNRENTAVSASDEPPRGVGVGASLRTPLNPLQEQQSVESRRGTLLTTPPTRDLSDRVLAANSDRYADGAVNGLGSYNTYSSPNARRYIF